MPLFNLQLNDCRFFAYHGVYEEEKILGGEFSVYVSLKAETGKEDPVTLEQTVNYAAVYDRVKFVFAQPEELLENICLKIAADVKQHFPRVKKISIKVTKLHPPIAGFSGSVSVSYNCTF